VVVVVAVEVAVRRPQQAGQLRQRAARPLPQEVHLHLLAQLPLVAAVKAAAAVATAPALRLALLRSIG
jgi:hypothetical protein